MTTPRWATLPVCPLIASASLHRALSRNPWIVMQPLWRPEGLTVASLQHHTATHQGSITPRNQSSSQAPRPTRQVRQHHANPTELDP